MKLHFGFLSVVFLSLSAVSSAQYLRTSAYAAVSTSAGNSFQQNEQPWLLSAGGSTLTRNAMATNIGGTAHTQFTAEFGSLKGSTHAALDTTGTAYASSQGLFSSFNSFVGASFYDTLTLTGAGLVSLTINYTLHSINTDPNNLTFADTQLKMDTYSASLGSFHPGAIVHQGAGVRTDSASFTITGTAGSTFDLLGELSSLSTVQYNSGDSGFHVADSDALHTASIWITPTSGGFTSASGSSYLAPVPEPASLAVIGCGLLGLARRRRKA